MSKKKKKTVPKTRDIDLFYLRGRKSGSHGDARKEERRRACRGTIHELRDGLCAHSGHADSGHKDRPRNPNANSALLN